MSEKPQEEITNLRRLRVLVVDDQEAVCEVVADSIRYAGHDVIGVARDGVEAVTSAQELRPDLVVMDIVMPRLNGVEAMRSILEGKTATWVLLMSGEYRSLGLTRDEILKIGAVTLLEKPFSVTEMFSWLDRLSTQYTSQSATPNQ